MEDSILVYEVPYIRKSVFCAFYSYNLCDSYNKVLVFSLSKIAPHRDASMCSGGKAPSTLHFDSKVRRRFSFSHSHVKINESFPTIHWAGWIPDPVWKPWRREMSLSTIGNRTPVRPSSNPQSNGYTNRNILSYKSYCNQQLFPYTQH